MEAKNLENGLKVSILTKILAFILIGMISTTFAELWLGYVFIIGDPTISLLEMIIFYGLHVVFYYNLAIRFRKSSLTALYWWGTLFGLYEAWTTTMAYYGYYNVIGHHGEILGIAVYEYFADVLYWHPINSFILTLMAIQILFYPAFTKKMESSMLPKTFIINTKRNKWFWGLYFIYMTGMLTSCTLGYEAIMIIYFLIFYGVMLIIYLILKKLLEKKELSPLHVLRMGDRALWFIGGLIAIYYLFSFAVAVGGEPIYEPIALFDLVSLIYLIIAVIVYPKKKQYYVEEEERYILEERNVIQKTLIFFIYIIGILIIDYYLFIFISIAWINVYNPMAFVIIFLTYVWIILMLKKVKTNDELGVDYFDERTKEDALSKGWVLIGILVPLILSLLVRKVLFIAWILSVFSVEITMVLGMFLVVYMSYKVITKKR